MRFSLAIFLYIGSVLPSFTMVLNTGSENWLSTLVLNIGSQHWFYKAYKWTLSRVSYHPVIFLKALVIKLQSTRPISNCYMLTQNLASSRIFELKSH